MSIIEKQNSAKIFEEAVQSIRDDKNIARREAVASAQELKLALKQLEITPEVGFLKTIVKIDAAGYIAASPCYSLPMRTKYGFDGSKCCQLILTERGFRVVAAESIHSGVRHWSECASENIHSHRLWRRFMIELARNGLTADDVRKLIKDEADYYSEQAANRGDLPIRSKSRAAKS